MYQRILVPVDNSDTSAAAIIEGRRFAGDQRAKVKLIHVVDLAQFAWSANEFLDVPQLQNALRQSGEKLLAELAEGLRADGLDVETSLLESWGGNLALAIVNEASSWPADLIVMGTHGYGGLTHLLMGSVAEGVVHATPVPVLLVRAKANDK
ncbi:universal stress protein [Iodobacter fluviatilis]|uniref:Universal stress protein n=1 Tax=Iodobacter fluviatilis TaxID=537 RepID=A0A377QAD7_9NEIS|nr:universal stress protein [Iodobacter fluviatilis]TCU89451.1 nucleotide-binding universal stress UspA family protein [Iodobacter fluviatilis]STQ90821.1 Universal stress protein Rv2005c/MT2061 [Iodobacter fluviatilis]